MFIAEPEFVNLKFFKEAQDSIPESIPEPIPGLLESLQFRLLCKSAVCGGGGILGDQYSNTSSVTRYRNYRIRELWEFILKELSTIVREKCGSLSRKSFNGVRELWEFISKAFHWCQKNVGVHPESLLLVSENCGSLSQKASTGVR
jgi:hypothetical protein